uniref:Uncharacterized protein n=1 Tax=Periplaneta americana TaxID=6978 RepID=A0ABQ8TTF8_PERAM|nr:hypothetical protein ANN_01403 [Periplaneta americana]
MCKAAQVLEGVPVGEFDGVCVCDIPLFKYARLTSCDVEGSFSQYKSLFRDNRHTFVMENLEMTFVVRCNSRPTTSIQVWLAATRLSINGGGDSGKIRRPLLPMLRIVREALAGGGINQTLVVIRSRVGGKWDQTKPALALTSRSYTLTLAIELHALYSSPDIIRNIKSRRLRWAGHVVRMGESRNAYRVLVGRPEGKRPLGSPSRRWEDNIKMDLRKVGYDDKDWINLAQDRGQWRAYVRAAMNLRVP